MSRTSTVTPTTWTHREWVYHVTTWRIAPGYGAKATRLHCDWGKSWGNYDGAYSGWSGTPLVERACWDHEDETRVIA